MVRNSFSSRPLAHLVNGLVTNHKSRLFMLKMGELECSEAEFVEFIEKGVKYAFALRYLHVTSQHSRHPCIQRVNNSNSFVSISCQTRLTVPVERDHILKYLKHQVENESNPLFSR